jgi:peptidoglycan/xylan/chitin deacetylase (PgdA/CDA1 family)
MTTLLDDRPLEATASADSPDCPVDSRYESVVDGLRALTRMTASRISVPFSKLFGPRREGAFGILMYHRISPRFRGAASPTWNVTPARFRSQMIGLLNRGYTPWPLKKVIEHDARGERIPPRVFVVTFDDGYANNYTNAWPVLKELKIPATIFLATAYLESDEPFPFDDWSAAGSSAVPLDSWIPLTQSQCEEMCEGGLIELAAHTRTHADFRNNPEFLEADLDLCLEVLNKRFGITDPTFAFPYGTRRLGYSGPTLNQVARRLGTLCALTTESHLVKSGDDPFDWGRFTAEGSDTAAILAAKLDGWYEFMFSAKRAFQRRTAMAG